MNLNSVKEKVVAITGAAGIIGSQSVRALVEEGAYVAFSDISKDSLQALSESLSGKSGHFLSSHVDLRDENQISHWFLNIQEKFGTVDVLINNAQGKPKDFYEPFETYPIAALREVMAVNLESAILCSQQVIRGFLKKGQGNIINIGSIYGLLGPDQRIYDQVKNPYSDQSLSSPVSYAVSKAGILQLTRYLASYYREKNIRVNSLTPGGVFDNHDENFTQQYSSRTLLGRMANRTEYIGAILFLASEASSYMTGANLVVDGGWSAF